MMKEHNEEIFIQLGYIEETISHLCLLLNDIEAGEPENHQMAAVGAYLVNFYNGIENILKNILRSHNLDLPGGMDWHLQLLNMFGSKGHPKLPHLIDEEMMRHLDTYRAFHHLFVHGYVILLRWERLRPNAERALSIFATFRHKIEEYLKSEESQSAQ